MRKIFVCFVIFTSVIGFAQKKPGDSLFLMNGRILIAPVIDTLFGAATFIDPGDSTKRAHVENDQLFAIRYHNGDVFYYYQQDTISNWFSRDEMWMFMQGERDAKKGFKPRGSLFGTMALGLAGGITGSFFAPIAPVVYTALVGLPRVKIKHNTVSNINYLDSDAYILGYERESRARRRIYALIGSGVGMLLGYTTYFAWLKHEPKYPF
ncbi:MAG TPA: hypothetical protein VNZ49_04925 [Bacteroidia bacterium]|jgi:hypothetical protein|nr:hypothetical protein [Bacteroidia bacterium]